MVHNDEVAILVDQYGGVYKANKRSKRAVRSILEPVLGSRSKTNLRTLQESLWARSQRRGDRYADLASALNAMIKKK